MILGGKKAIPDCQQLARYPSDHLKHALAPTYAGDLGAPVCHRTGSSSLAGKFISNVGEEFYFLTDDVGVFGTDPDSLDSVSMEER